MAEDYLACRVYKNVRIMLEKYRKLTIKEKLLNDADCKNQINHIGYIILTGGDDDKVRRSGKNFTTVVVITDISSTYLSDSNSLHKMMSAVTKGRDYNMELILITRNEISSTLDKTYNKYASDKLITRTCTYQPFFLELPLHPSNGQCVILTHEQEKSILKELNLEKNQLKKIKYDDKLMLWLGAEKSNIVEILFDSKTCGKQVDYRIVVN